MQAGDGLGLEVVEDLDNAERPGCLFATYCYESGLFEDEIKEIIRLAILKWRTALVEKLEAAAVKHPPKSEVDFDSLADLLTGIFEGVYRSTDGGASWSNFSSGLDPLSAIPLAIAPGPTSTLYTGTFGGGIFKSN